MKVNRQIPVAVLFACIFTFFFYGEKIGLNLLLIEISAITVLLLQKEINFSNRNLQIFISGVIATAFAVIFVYSPYVIAINIMSLIMLTGALLYPEAKSPITILRLAVANIPSSQHQFLRSFSKTKSKPQRKSRLKNVFVFFIPACVIIFFILLYRGSSPYFDKLMINMASFFSFDLIALLSRINFLLLFTFIFGLFLSAMFFFRKTDETIVKSDQTATDELSRANKKQKRIFKLTALNNEHKAGIFLFLMLNFILFTVNSLDIYWVWFNFEWSGQVLKEFVHEGTYLLLLSILCSIVLVLYFFRGNLNFYGKNLLLRRLCYLWVLQNALLTISVGVRNFHYIDYFGLAYKRIGLILFLMLTLYGLYTVSVKVRYIKSDFYLIRKNVLALYLILVLSSLVNWENFIAKYNFANAGESFVELRYMARFPDKSLPILDENLATLEAIKQFQQREFSFEQNDMSSQNYYDLIAERKRNFKEQYVERGVLSWNWPEYKAYRNLSRRD